MIIRAVSLCFSQIAINPPGYKDRERPPPPHTHAHTEFPLVSMTGASWSRRFLIKKKNENKKEDRSGRDWWPSRNEIVNLCLTFFFFF